MDFFCWWGVIGFGFFVVWILELQWLILSFVRYFLLKVLGTNYGFWLESTVFIFGFVLIGSNAILWVVFV